MSALIDIVNLAVKAVGGARTAGRVLGRETPELDDLHQALAPVRRRRLPESMQTSADDSGDGDDGTSVSDASGAAVEQDPDIDGDGVVGVVADAAHWIMDKIDQLF